MARLLINIDVPALNPAVEFYTQAFDLRVGRRLAGSIVELLGAEAPIYLLAKEARSAPSPTVGRSRDYERHWTPVHLDFVVTDLDAALERAVRAGARPEAEISTHEWGRFVPLADPFGHGVCLVELSERGYDAIALG